MANYRNQFNRVLNNDSYPALVSMLQKKVQELGSNARQVGALRARQFGGCLGCKRVPGDGHGVRHLRNIPASHCIGN
jgi:hypothetical protein